MSSTVGKAGSVPSTPLAKVVYVNSVKPQGSPAEEKRPAVDSYEDSARPRTFATPAAAITPATLDSYAEQTVDSVQVDANAPDAVNLSGELKARLKTLEDAAADNAAKPLTGAMVQNIVQGLRKNPLAPEEADQVAQRLEGIMKKAGITTTRQKAAFVAQSAEETRGFEALSETGSRSRFRGRGFLQVTGRTNYRAYSQSEYGDNRAVKHPETLATAPDADDSAAWYWSSHGLNDIAETGSFKAVTKRINGGTNGWATRLKCYTRALAEFARE
jgi:predicted chitinase